MKYLVRLAAVSLLVLPAFAGAQSNADVAAQAKALLDQITQLQAQLGVSGGTPSGGACYTGGPVKPGASGANVTALQKFLAADPSVYPDAKVTGYFGPLTQAAVGRWQAKKGIVSSGTPASTGFGSVGPRTAAAMAAPCGGVSSTTGGSDETVGGFIKVSPVTGEPPLKVSVEATINTVKSCLPATYTLSWGDGTQPISISIPANKCDVLSQIYTHTYTLGGDYSVTLSSGIHETTTVVTVNGGGGVSLGGSASFGGNSTGGSSETGGSSATGASLAGTVVSGSLAIAMGSHSFSPSSATIKSGTRVTWTNSDSSSHTVSADNASYNSGTLQPGQTYSLVFSAKGEYTYYCAFHGGPGGAGMSGKLIVQ